MLACDCCLKCYRRIKKVCAETEVIKVSCEVIEVSCKPRQRREEFDLNIEINGHKMIRVKEVTFLGVIFWMKTFHTNHIFHILVVKFLNLLILLVDQVLVSLSLP